MITLFYEVPAMDSIDQAAADMIALAERGQKESPSNPVQIAAVFNGVAIGATPNSTVAEVVKSWDDRRREWIIQEETCRPVVEAIRYLLNSLPPNDRSYVKTVFGMRQ
jgi:hypothetical protein